MAVWCFLVCVDGLRLTSSAKVCFFGFVSRCLDFVVADNISENCVVCMFLNNAAQAENVVFCLFLSA